MAPSTTPADVVPPPAVVVTEPPVANEPAAAEPANAAEPAATAASSKKPLEQGAQLDLAFILDSTGSMGSYIASATQSIVDIVNEIVRSERADVRFGLVAYRDHPPQDSSWITKVFPFSSSTAQMKKNLAELSAAGGGDGPEAVTTALHETLNLPWRPNATKMAVIIADAPPHGLGEQGDGFPNGEPNGIDPLKTCREYAAHGITLYAVGCEPALSNYMYAVDFFRAISGMTGGTLLPLSSAALLPKVIVGGAREQMDLDKIAADAYQLAEENRKKGMSEKEVSANVYQALKQRNVQSKQLHVESLYEKSEAAESNIAFLAEAESLGALKNSNKLKKVDVRLKSSAASGGMASLSISSYSDAPEMCRKTAAPAPMKKGGMGFMSKMFTGSVRKSAAPMPAPSGAPVLSAPPLPACEDYGAPSASCAPASEMYAQKVEFKEAEEISEEQVARLVNKSRYASKSSAC